MRGVRVCDIDRAAVVEEHYVVRPKLAVIWKSNHRDPVLVAGEVVTHDSL